MKSTNYGRGHKNRINKKCVVCGKAFEVVKSMSNRYVCCSKNCTKIHRMTYNNGFKKGHIVNFTPEIREKISLGLRGKLKSEEHKQKIRISKTKELNNLILREHDRIRHSGEYLKWRMYCIIRDNFACAICLETGCKLEVHHIQSFSKYPNLRFNINNGITLCKECHAKVDKVRNYMLKK